MNFKPSILGLYIILMMAHSNLAFTQPPNCQSFNISGTLNGSPTDWFGPNRVVDATAYTGIGFIGMSVQPNTLVNGILYHKALYGRDYCSNDSTAFVSANKNGEDPSVWTTGRMQVQNKNDIIDVYAHSRRLGTTLNDPIIMYFGLAKPTNDGQAFWSAELFAQCLDQGNPLFSNCTK